MDAMLKRKYLTDDSRSQLLFALAGVLDARGDYAGAALRLEPANALQASARAGRGQFYDLDQYSRFIERIIAAFTPELIAQRQGWGDPDPRPVFVVGLPRSGTTLIEQILASHPKVHGAGELPDVRRVFQSLPTVVGLPVGRPVRGPGRPGPDFDQGGGPRISRPTRRACVPDGRPHRRQDARQRRSSGSDCLALALGLE